MFIAVLRIEIFQHLIFMIENYAVISSELDIDNTKEAILNLNIDIEICPVMII